MLGKVTREGHKLPRRTSCRLVKLSPTSSLGTCIHASEGCFVGRWCRRNFSRVRMVLEIPEYVKDSAAQKLYFLESIQGTFEDDANFFRQRKETPVEKPHSGK